MQDCKTCEHFAEGTRCWDCGMTGPEIRAARRKEYAANLTEKLAQTREAMVTARKEGNADALLLLTGRAERCERWLARM